MAIKSARNPAMDVIRCFALFCVVSVHFFLNTDFYDIPVSGLLMYVMVLVRSGFMVCVPLFLILSGYLMRSKTPSLKYYTKFTYTISIYLLASICCQLYKWFVQDVSISLSVFVTDVLSFTAAPYAWYIEMYIGLFLLIPYLNILYNNIPSKIQKQILLAILILLVSLPGIVNIYNVYNIFDINWWLTPSISDKYHQILPVWWTSIYPILYYFLGCYLSEYPLKLSSRTNVILVLLVFFVNGTFNYYRSCGVPFLWGIWQDYGSFLILLQTTLLFNLLSQGNYTWLGKKSQNLLAKLSDWCLGAYLVSWIFDAFFYGILNKAALPLMLQLPYFPVIVPAVYIGSLCLSGILNGCYRLISHVVLSWIKPKSRTR